VTLPKCENNEVKNKSKNSIDICNNNKLFNKLDLSEKKVSESVRRVVSTVLAMSVTRFVGRIFFMVQSLHIY